MEETVQQLADVVRRLVGEEAAGDLVLPGLLPGSPLAASVVTINNINTYFKFLCTIINIITYNN